MSGSLAKLDDFYMPEVGTKAERDFIANKERDLKVYGHYVVTIEELEKLQIAIEEEERAMATKKKPAKKVAKKTAKKVAKKKSK